MRRLFDEPRATDFVLASEYEALTPAAFGLPEVPVLYASCSLQHQDCLTHIWVASDGLYVWANTEGFLVDLDAVQLLEQQLSSTDFCIHLDETNARTVARALRQAHAFNAAIDAHEDDVEIAVPMDYESGQADDLGDTRLEHSVGIGLSLKSGPAMPAKRRRPS